MGGKRAKKLTQMSNKAVGVVNHQLHNFLIEATWDAALVNERLLQVDNLGKNQTKLKICFIPEVLKVNK